MQSVLLIYHFFHPDPVISARLFSDLAKYLAENGFEVTVFTGNRLIRSTEELPLNENWNGVQIQRFKRPAFSQSSNVGRLINSAILQMKWLLAFRKHYNEFDSVIIGTDPQFAYMMFPFLRMMNPKVRLIHWVFDLYPEAILVNSPYWMKFLAGLTKPFLPWAYRKLDDIVDIGICMRKRLQQYHHHAHCETLTPWALMEPQTIPEADPETRQELFGNADLGLLYSGTVGYAHNLEPFIQLARKCRQRNISVAFCFAGYGNCFKTQVSMLTPEDTNIRIADFANEKDLEKRLASADIHMISLRPGWEGIVVPSKFFGALAIGRPVLFSGPGQSEIAQWCIQMNLGWLLSENTTEELEGLLSDKHKIDNLKQHVFQYYHQNFSRECILKQWKKLLSTTSES